jgi:dihydrofolate synthase/folylpolyglutamate synthase
LTYTKNDPLKWLEDSKRLGSRPGLESVSGLLRRLGNPQHSYKVVHVTGTNGKGSTCALTQSILTAGGSRVGLFTSPHLHDVTESITINGEQVSKEQLASVIDEICPRVEAMEKEHVRHPTHFELLTAAAFKYFEEENVDYAVVEVGMGGRDDATNVVDSMVSVITNISLEHTTFLGETIREIAETKAGIIKEGSTLVTAAEQPEIIQLFKEICLERGYTMVHVGTDVKAERISTSLRGQVFNVQTGPGEYRELFIPLLGRHQLKNAMCAVAAATTIDPLLTEEAIRKGVASVQWPGRLEVVNRGPLVLLDGAKDLKAVEALVETLTEDIDYGNLISVVSISSDKNIEGMIKTLSEATDSYILTRHRVSQRAADPERLAEHVKGTLRPYRVIQEVEEALGTALDMASLDDLVLVTGSVFFVGEARELLQSLFSSSG